ncbi:MAG: hypothetical protein ABI591_27805 [Kofleriaceae bacterium]
MKRVWICALLGACGNGNHAAPDAALPTWDKTLPPASVMGTFRGLSPARGILHLHSPYSHDACDNMPRDANGVPNEPCLQDLRAALCTDQIDFADLTDHDASMADEDFPTLFSPRAGDVPVINGNGDQIGSRMTCGDGHVVTFTVGGENDLMPIMLHHHPVAATIAERHAIYNGIDAASVQAFRDAGGLTWVAHTEQHDLDQLRTLLPDGIELYNLHANIDPKIRSMYLGLDSAGAITAAVNFADTQPGHPEPDLALLSFISPSTPALTRWDQLLADGHHIPATAGSDAHQNALPVILADGERGDSYRRVLRWFSNVALVQDTQDMTQIEAALKAGRMFAVFEMMGTPLGFDVHADAVEMGGTANVGSTLTVNVPTIRNLDPSLPTPEIRANVIRVTASGPQMVASSTDATVSVPLDQPGAYRVEITIIPHHLGPYLGDLGTGYADVELPWIYANPIYVE